MLKIGTLNCRSLKKNIHKIIQKFHLLKLDILVLQETYSIDQHSVDLLQNQDLQFFIHHECEENSAGVGLIASQSIDLQIIEEKDSRILHFYARTAQNSYEILNIYAPADQGKNCLDFYRNLGPMLKSKGQNKFILLGDMNVIENTNLDRSRPAEMYDQRVAPIQRVLSRHLILANLVDSFRTKHPTLQHYTYRSPSHNILSRLDRIYIESDLAAQIHESTIDLSEMVADHRLAYISINENAEIPRGRSYPKLNPIWLKNDTFCEQIANFLGEWRDEILDFESTLEWWQLAKQNIMKIYKNFVINHITTQNRLLSSLYDDYADSSKSDEHLNQIWTNIETILKDKVNAKGQSSGIEFFKNSTEDEFMSHYLRLKRIRNSDNSIPNMLINDKTQTVNEKELHDHILGFYENIFKSSNPKSEDIDLFLDTELPHLNEEIINKFDDFINLEELTEAVNKMAINKSPGPDGLPVEFYKKFWDILGPDLIMIFNNIFLANEPTKKFNESVIRLIYKNKGKRNEIGNWRPISLLNADYKILMKVHAERMQEALKVIINPGQSCAVPGRSMFDNLYSIDSMITHLSETNQRALFVSLDQAKAFDRVEHKYLFKTMEKFGFPESLIKWLRILYMEAKAQIDINGKLTDPFDIERSVRQGDPGSMALFIIQIEPLARRIIEDKQIKGIKVPNSNPTKIFLHADDTLLPIPDIKSYRKSMGHFELYSKASGSALNLAKTEVLALGQWLKSDLGPIDKWIKPQVEILGIHFGENMQFKNWSKLLAKCDGILHQWRNHTLSLKTKLYVIQTYVLSNTLHVMRVIGMEEKSAIRLQRSIFQYIWGGSFEKIKRTTCYLPYKEGGMNVPNIQTLAESLQITKISKLEEIKVKSTPWMGYLIYSMGFHIREVHPYVTKGTYVKTQLEKPWSIRLTKPYDKIRAKQKEIQIWKMGSHRPYYDLLLDKVKPEIVSRNSRVPWEKIWTLLWENKKLDRIEKEFLYLQLLAKLPTSKGASSIAIRVASPDQDTCHFCHVYHETNDHIFQTCPALEHFRIQVMDDLTQVPVLRNATLGRSFLNTIPFIQTNANSHENAFENLFYRSFAYKKTIWRLRGKLHNGQTVEQSDLMKMYNKTISG